VVLGLEAQLREQAHGRGVGLGDLRLHERHALGREVVHRPATPEAFGAALGATLGSAEIGAGIAQMYATVAAAAPDAAVLDPAPLERAVGVRMASVPDWLRRNFR